MDKVSCRLSVFFEEPFWIGVFERISEGRLSVCKVTFGAEPKDYEVYAFLLQNWRRLRFSPPVREEKHTPKPDNPKRRQRAARRTVKQASVGTKAQQALAAQREQSQQARRVRTREEKEREAEERYEKHRQKRREKHKGH